MRGGLRGMRLRLASLLSLAHLRSGPLLGRGFAVRRRGRMHLLAGAAHGLNLGSGLVLLDGVRRLGDAVLIGNAVGLRLGLLEEILWQL